MPLPFATFRSAFKSADDEYNGLGKRPVVFDIMTRDRQVSLLPDNLKLVLHVNPTSMKIDYQKIIERVQTRGGYVEQHFGEGTKKVAFECATGGFMRLFTGLTNITGGGMDVGGTRRQSIAYDKFLDIAGLFHGGGHITDINGKIVIDGIVKMSFDGNDWFGWIEDFSVSEAAEKPYQFTFSFNFVVSHEKVSIRSVVVNTNVPSSNVNSVDATTVADENATANEIIEDAMNNWGKTQLFPPEALPSEDQIPTGSSVDVPTNVGGIDVDDGPVDEDFDFDL